LPGQHQQGRTSSGEQVGAVLNEFEKTAWVGIEAGRYAWAAVDHRKGAACTSLRRPGAYAAVPRQ